VLGFLTDQQSRTSAQAIVSAHAVRTTMREWTAGARLTTEGDAEFRGTPASRTMGGPLASASNDPSDAELAFVTNAATQIAPAGTRVRIYMKRAGEDTSRIHGLVAELTPWRRLGAPVILSLAPDATGFQARYLGSLFGRRVWQRSWISTSVLPVAVELHVLFDSTTASPDRAAHALLALPMTIPLEAHR
jgi:hypothetical protein